MDGKETELDKTIIEAIKDPLTHLVRNAVDHGIETPRGPRGARQAARRACCRCALPRRRPGQHRDHRRRRRHRPGARCARKAIERGLSRRSGRAHEPIASAIKLIFLPGFSTAETSPTSPAAASAWTSSRPTSSGSAAPSTSRASSGEGTTLRIKIPLTLAIIPALMVATGGERFAIPQVSLLELVRLEGRGDRDRHRAHPGRAVPSPARQLLPLVVSRSGARTCAGHARRRVVNIVVLQADDRQFGLVVDAVNDTEEIVVKPLGKQFKSINVFAGATIMGDGRVALILDVPGVAQRAGVVSRLDARADRQRRRARRRSVERTTRRRCCCSASASSDRMAIPLDLVARLEEFPASRIEQSGDAGSGAVSRRDPAARQRRGVLRRAGARRPISRGR